MQVLTIVLLMTCNGQNPGSSTSGTSHNKFSKMPPPTSIHLWTRCRILLRITHTIISQSIADSSWITLYNSEQVTRCIPNVCCSSDGAIDDRECDSRGEEMMKCAICIFVLRAVLDATEEKKLAIQNRQLMHITLRNMRQPSPQILYIRGSQTFLVRGTLFRYAKYSGTSLM